MNTALQQENRARREWFRWEPTGDIALALATELWMIGVYYAEAHLLCSSLATLVVFVVLTNLIINVLLPVLVPWPSALSLAGYALLYLSIGLFVVTILSLRRGRKPTSGWEDTTELKERHPRPGAPSHATERRGGRPEQGAGPGSAQDPALVNIPHQIGNLLVYSTYSPHHWNHPEAVVKNLLQAPLHREASC